MRISIIFPLVFHILCLLAPSQANKEEAEALLKWKINGLSSSLLDSSWSVNNLTNVCNWEGIICNRGGSVSELNLPHESIRDVSYFKGKVSYTYESSATLMVKGLEASVVRILKLYTSIDLSSNMFHGEIPVSIGNHLYTLRLLNLSHNRLTGHIPSSLGNLTLLEALDMSCNQLIGKIPWQLSKLGFLEVLNLSYNHLYGEIPRSGQLDTFDNNSYLGNTALCGFPLTLECEAKNPPMHSKEEEQEDSGFFNGFSWQSVTIGYSCAFPFGVCVGYFALRYGKLNWLLRKLTWKRGMGSKNAVPRRRGRTIN